MKKLIVGDSSCDVDAKLQEELGVTLVPLSMEVDEQRYVDNEALDLSMFLEKMNQSDKPMKSSCPSPEDFLSAYRQSADEIYCVTLSSKLSGSYHSAELAKSLYNEEEKEAKQIHVFDSKSAAAGEVAIAMKINEFIKKNMDFHEVVEKTEKYIKEMTTLFVLDKLDNLEKAGRLSLIKAKIVNILNIKLVLGDEEGKIISYTQARGMKKALDKMLKLIGEKGRNFSEKHLVISHCYAAERAEQLKKMIEQLYDFKEIVIVQTKGLSSSYANFGGVIIAF